MGATLPSLHFLPGGVERVQTALQSYFVIKEIEPGVSRLEPVKEPKTKLSLWEEEDERSGKAITGKDVIQDNLVEEHSGPNNLTGYGDNSRSQPELPLERPVIVRAEPVTLDEFNLLLKSSHFKLLKENIFKGGLTAEARPAAWNELLGVNTLSDREEKYLNLRRQWETLTPEQESLCSLLKERRNLIAKDVIRTEPTRLVEEEIKRLQDLLTTYCVFDQDLGYVQGMSDIAVVILDLYGDDCEAFWVFTRFMQRIRGNFEKSQRAIKQQFEALRRVLAFTDGEMVRFLDKRDSGHMYFTFPWFLIIFRRLATWETLPLFWDVWLTSPCSNFHLLIAAAILDLYRDELMQDDYGYCEILQFVNRLNGEVNPTDILARAQSLLVQIENCISTPPVVKQLLDI